MVRCEHVFYPESIHAPTSLETWVCAEGINQDKVEHGNLDDGPYPSRCHKFVGLSMYLLMTKVI